MWTQRQPSETGEELPVGLEARRAWLMRDAANEMLSLEPSRRTLALFETLTAAAAAERGWDRASFQRQHLRNHLELRKIYEAARFPDRKTLSPRAPHGSKSLDRDELVARLAEMATERDLERARRKKAEEKLARLDIDRSVEIVREFMHNLGLRPKG